MDTIKYRTKGTCSSEMNFEIENGRIVSLKVIGGCSGNLQGISSIIRNKTIDEVIEAFDGIRCGIRPTSCPDQIAQALKAYRTSKDESCN